MSIISKDGILKVLTAYNPWWKTGIVNPKMTKTYKRFAFHEALTAILQQAVLRVNLVKSSEKLKRIA